MSKPAETAQHEFSEDGIRRINVSYTNETIERKRTEWQEFIKDLEPYPGNYHGKGIVICAGGFEYFTCAWINIKSLRKSGCKLPVELWHQDGEVNSEAMSELEKLDVTFRNFADLSEEDISNGYRLKPMAILHSSFKEILFLDADNNCLRDPSFLFDDPDYKNTGAVFWPDYWKTERSNPIWQIVGSHEYDIPEQESGQILIDKEKCWRALNLCLFFNFDPFYYNILWGDKDTFKFSWMALESPFHMISKEVGALGFRDERFGFGSVAMLQHDLQGEPLFVHSNLLKWYARSSAKLYWQKIRRKAFGSDGAIKMNYHPNFRKYFLSIGGESEIIQDRDPIATLERESLTELEDLRNTSFYQKLSPRENQIGTPIEKN